MDFWERDSSKSSIFKIWNYMYIKSYDEIHTSWVKEQALKQQNSKPGFVTPIKQFLQ